MFSRRLFDLTLRPLSTFQSFIRYPFVQQVASNNSAITASDISPDKFHQIPPDTLDPNSYEQTSSSVTYPKSTSLLSSIPGLETVSLNLDKLSWIFGSAKLEKDKLRNRFAMVQYASNDPIEDRWAVKQLHAIPGYLAMVFDGHGGWQVADYAMEHLPQKIDDALKANKSRDFESDDEYIIASLKEAFDEVENGFLQIAREAYRIGLPRTGKVGACALVTLVHGNKVYTANAGDCQGIICRNESDRVTFRKTNHKLNANSKKEQRRLKEQFMDEDIFVCKRGDSKSFYVKNRLQPTRAFGDFALKYSEFNYSNAQTLDQEPSSGIRNFKGPYITHEPEIQVLELNSDDKYLVMSSDGMWDELSKQEVAQIVERTAEDKQTLCEEILNNALVAAAKKRAMSEEDLRKVSVGRRRRYHDDMTILVVDLENQAK